MRAAGELGRSEAASHDSEDKVDMTSMAVHERVARYLNCMRELRAEIQNALEMIAGNSLTKLEESVRRQEDLNARLRALLYDIAAGMDAEPEMPLGSRPCDLLHDMHAGATALGAVTEVYGALLLHSRRSVGQLLSALRPFHAQEVARPALNHQGWSCQM